MNEAAERAMAEMTPTRYAIGDISFQSQRLSPQEQIHCVRRILPLVKAAGPILKLMAENGGVSGLKASLETGAAGLDPREELEAAASGSDTGAVDALTAMGPLADVLAAMSDADVDYVIGKCMARTHANREGETGWQPVWSGSANASIFAGLRLNHYLRVCFETLKFSLSDAFPDLVRALEDVAGKRSGPTAPVAA